MADPLRRLKFLPWLPLLQLAALTTAIIIAIEFLLLLVYANVPAFRQSLELLFAPPLGILVNFATAIGVGALVVVLLERLYRQVIINTATLWALVLCLALGLGIKTLLPVPPFLISLGQMQLVGAIVGVFWKGRPYWRSL